MGLLLEHHSGPQRSLLWGVEVGAGFDGGGAVWVSWRSYLRKPSLHFFVWKWFLTDPDRKLWVINLERHKSIHIQIKKRSHSETSWDQLNELNCPQWSLISQL